MPPPNLTSGFPPLTGLSSVLRFSDAIFEPRAAHRVAAASQADVQTATNNAVLAASELGGSAPVQVLKPSGSETLPDGESALTVTPGAVRTAVAKLMKG